MESRLRHRKVLVKKELCHGCFSREGQRSACPSIKCSCRTRSVVAIYKIMRYFDMPTLGSAWPLNCHTHRGDVHNEKFRQTSPLLTCFAAAAPIHWLLSQPEGSDAEILRQRPEIRPKGEESGSSNSVSKRTPDRQELRR